MQTRFQVHLSDPLDALARVVARLHAVRADIHELHLEGSVVCLHLGQRAERALAVLRRHQDGVVVDGCGCGGQDRPDR